MPSKIDQAFIDNLQKFTEALDGVVKILQQQAEKGDVMNKMSSNMDGDKMGEITENIKEILDISKKVDNRTKEILKEIKASKKQKETGMFGQVSDKSNKKKIVDGIGIILLIAGGVLAIGMAFKIIGKVDFMSVVALSLGIYLVSKSFAEIAGIKNLTPKKMLLVGISLLMISAAITLSSIILLAFQPMKSEKMLSFIVVSAGLGIASYFIFKAAKSMKVTDLPKYFLLPIVLPLIASGIVLSSFILQYVKTIPLMAAVSAIMVAAVIAVGAFAIMMVLKALGKVTIAKMLMAVSMIPLIALGIVMASIILQAFVPLSNPMKVLISSVVMGIALLMFAPTVYILGKMDIKQMLTGALGVVVLSLAIVASSWILGMGKYDGSHPSLGWAFTVGLSLLLFAPTVWLLGKLGLKEMLIGSLGVVVLSLAIVAVSWILSFGKWDGGYPSLRWSFSVGISLLIFSIPVIILGLIAMSGGGAVALLAGALAVVVLSAVIAGVSWILSFGNYGTYPDWKWALGVGLSLLLFGISLAVIGLIALTGIGLLAMLAGAPLAVMIAATIVQVSGVISQGTYGNYPDLEWAMGTGLALAGFGIGMALLGAIPFGEKLMSRGAERVAQVAQAIVDSSRILSGGDYKGGPTQEWASAVGLSLGAFANALMLIEDSDILDGDPAMFTSFMSGIAQAMVDVSKILAGGSWTDGPGKNWSENVAGALSTFTTEISKLDDGKIDIIEDFADAISNLADSIKKLNDSGLDKLNKLTTSVTIMSVVDDKKLKDVLRVMDENKEKLSNVIQQKGGYTPTTTGKQTVTSVSTIGTSSSKDDTQLQLLNNIIEMNKKFDDLLEYVVQSESGKDVKTDDKVKK